MSIRRNYISKNHSKYLIKYHVIFVCKYRRKLLCGALGLYLKNALVCIAQKSDFDIEVIESDKDHVHLLISSEPKISPLQIVRKLKQESTIRLWKQYPNILHRWFYRENTLWTDGYFISSIGNVSQDIVQKYIENQG